MAAVTASHISRENARHAEFTFQVSNNYFFERNNAVLYVYIPHTTTGRSTIRILCIYVTYDVLFIYYTDRKASDTTSRFFEKVEISIACMD